MRKLKEFFRRKPEIAFYWCASCGGCDEAVFDMAEDITKITDMADIIFWPIAMDTRYEDIKAFKDKRLFATFINGAVRTFEQEKIAKLLRQKSKLIIANGSCAHTGGVIGLANFFTKEEILKKSYANMDITENPGGIIPGHDGSDFSVFYGMVKPLNQVIDVDYYIPGCPPEPELIKNALFMILKGKLPEKGRVLAEDKALCHYCHLLDTMPEKIFLQKFKRLHETLWDNDKCFLSQGIICMGPVTRGGCGSRCVKAGMPCRGCFGPLDNSEDMGIKALLFVSALIDGKDEATIREKIDTIPDPAGLFYRYSLAASILKGKITDN